MKFSWLILFLSALPLWSGNTTVLFQPSAPSVGPFPANAVTVPDSTQKTGLQVSLPAPAGCTPSSAATECVNNRLLNQLDGFSLNPRLRICFSGPVDPNTLSAGVNLLSLDRTEPFIAIRQVLFDPAGNCAFAKPERVLSQQSRYLLTVTSDVADSDGKKLKADKSWSDCIKKPSTDYCRSLSQAVSQAPNSKDLVSASLFTTMSATSWLQQARAAVNSAAIPGAGSLLGPLTTFNLTNQVSSIVWAPQTSLLGFGSQPVPLDVLAGVERIAFGLVMSPLYLDLAGSQAGTIKTTATNLPLAPPPLVLPVSFHVFLPPANSVTNGKIPVIIYGHGLGDNQFGAPTYAAAAWARKGFATLAMEIPGHGFGPLSTTKVTTSSGSVVVPTPGRGVPLSLTAPIGPTDGCILPNAIATRDCSRQTAVDLISLIRAIRDTQGLGLNLDPSRIYYTGQSFGSMYGTLLEAVEPNVGAAALNGGGGTQADIARLSPVARQLGAAYLGSFSPTLLNVPPAPSQDFFHDSFNDEYVYRGQVVSDHVPGALAIQEAFEASEWLGMLGDPLSYAPHLKNAPLPGVSAKSILLQFGLGDLEVPNPTESALSRAAGLQSSTWMLNTLMVAGIEPQVLGPIQPGVPYPIYPHRFLSNPTLFSPLFPLETAIGVAAQNQIADFFASGGATVPDPNQYFTGPYTGLKLFQIPAVLPEDLNFVQIPR
jgi:hypothetical protein